MEVVFVTDGGSKSGMGHITRCQSLSSAFNDREIVCHFIINGDANIKEDHSLYNWNENLTQLRSDIKNADIVILDSLNANDEVIEEITTHARLPVFIDDFRRLHYKKGVVIDWTPFVEDQYELSNSNCIYLLGCEYISLREAFWNLSEKKVNEQVKEIVITMGGSDPRNMCPEILNLLLTHTPDTIVKTVIVGQIFDSKNINELKQLSKNNSCVKLEFDCDDKKMVALFLRADIVISAGGQTLYELARVGSPTIAILTFDNQKLDIEGWESAEFIDYAGAWDEATTYDNMLQFIIKLIPDKELREKKKEIGRSFIDGKGTKRIIDSILLQLEK